MTHQEIQAESDYRWLERAGIYAGDRPLTEQERKLIQEEIKKFEEKERLKPNTHYEDTPRLPKSTSGDCQQ